MHYMLLPALPLKLLAFIGINRQGMIESSIGFIVTVGSTQSLKPYELSKKILCSMH